MKRLLVFSVSALMLFGLLSSCDQLLDVKIDFSASEIVFTHGPDSLTGIANLSADSMKNELDSFVTSKGYSLNNLKSIKLKSCVIEVIDSAGNFNAMSFFEGYVSTPTLPQILVAAINPVPQDTNKISLIVNGTDLTNYLKSNYFSFILKANKTLPVDKVMTMKVYLKFEVSIEGI